MDVWPLQEWVAGAHLLVLVGAGLCARAALGLGGGLVAVVEEALPEHSRRQALEHCMRP